MIFVYLLLLETSPLDGLGVVWESLRLWWILESLYYPLFYGDLIVKTELDLGDCSGRLMVEKDSALCELLNRYVCILCGWSNFRNKSCVFVPTHFNLPIIFAQVCYYSNLVSLCLLILIYLLFLLKFVLT
jgi:hypothetical protein